MRDYEVVYIFRPELESDDVDDRLESFHDRLDGEVGAVEHWGERELAFEIEDERRGYYVVVQFRAEPASLSEFEQALKLDEDLIRHLLVLSEGELPTPPSQRRAEEEEEEEEEEEDEEEGETEADEDEEDEGEEEEEEDEEDEDGGGSGEEEDVEEDDVEEEDEDDDEEPREDEGDEGSDDDEEK